MPRKLSQLRMINFKRFADLSIENLPENARLVVLAGPNGNGKSSLFDGMLHWRRMNGGLGHSWDIEYHSRDRSKHRKDAVKIEFHQPAPTTAEEMAASFHVRPAHRNDPQARIESISYLPSATKEVRVDRLNVTDIGVSRNLQFIVAQDMELLHGTGAAETTFGEHRERLQSPINNAFKNLGLPLRMDSLGNPLATKTFRFSKGTTSGYHFGNLSGGERAIFDLLFDLIVQGEAFGEAIYCIDEPESHVNPNLHGQLLHELLAMVPGGGQLWIATHSIGMLRTARDLQRTRPEGEVVFLDFNQEFDQQVTLTPMMPSREFWQRALSTAVGDLAELVAPEIIIFCEGQNSAHELGGGTDAALFERIFAAELPEAVFTSIGSSTDVEGTFGDRVSGLFATLRGAKVIRLVDGDNRSVTERSQLEKRGIRVLSRRHIESYLFDDEILTKLCSTVGKPDSVAAVLQMKADAIARAEEAGHEPHNVKKWNKEFRASVTKHLQLTGNTVEGFMLDQLAPLVTSETVVYQELKRDIFGT